MANCVADRRGGGGTGRGPARAFTAVAVTVAVAGTVACATEPEVEWPDDPTRAPTATVAPAEAEAVTEILAVFERFRRAEVAILADPEPVPVAKDRLAEYLADPLLSLTLFDVATMRRRGVVREGRPSWDPTVTALRLDASPPTATVRDCLDATGWRLAEREGGAPAPADGLPARFAPDRYVMEFDARLIDDRWLFDAARVEEDGQC